MGNRNNRARGRGPSRERSAEALFEQALFGDSESDRRRFDPRADRKTLQLCRQVKRALMLALAGECDDDLLRDLSVDAVEPAGGAGHLVVTVSVPTNMLDGIPVIEVLARLNGRAGQLRAVVAQSICRKRVPMLSFTAVPMTEGGRDA